jgi:LmbE family N-acetylglucosaminyl deacetylase
MGAAAFQLARPGRAADNRAVQHPLQTWPLRRPQRLDHQAWPAGLAVAVLGPHPDDFDCIAVTLRHLHQRGARVAVAVLSTGISGVEDADADPPTPAHKAALRRAEQQASCRQFGLPADALAFLPLAEDGEGEPADTPGNAALVGAYLAARPPDLVFLPHGHDQKGGHRQVYALFRAAVAAHGLSVTALLNRDPKTVDLRLDAGLPYDAAAAEWKAGLLRTHATQQRRNLRHRGRGFDARILDMDQRSAADLGWADEGAGAEVFELEIHRAGRALPPPPI